MRRWKPVPSARLWLGVALLAACAVGAGLLLTRLALALLRPPEQWPVDAGLFIELLGLELLLLLGGAVAYRVVGALTLSYGVDRNGLYIFWLGNRAVVPLQRIESIEGGLPDSGGPRAALQSVGYYHGRVRLPEGRLVHRFSTQPLSRALVLHTSDDSYAISPQDADAFVQELEQRRRIGAIQQLSQGVEVGRTFFYAFWDDRVVRRALLLTLLLNLALLGWLMTIYPGLPALVDMRTDQLGAVATLRPRHQVLFLPLAAAVVALLNTGLGLSLYGREPAGARLLQVASAAAQILFAVAALTIVR